ncbi:MAG: T9SS type A sorting domain-containing protein [Fidelibacterota bacterium]
MNSRNTTLLVLYCLLLKSGGAVLAQNYPIDFETGGNGATWTWTVFENSGNPSLEIVTNPNTGGINSSATVAKFTALQTGQPWAGCESQHGSDIGTFSLDASNSTLKIMVYKTVISDVGLKFVIPTSGSLGEIKVANTITNAWEELTFDFSSHIGLPEAIGIDQIVVFPDFNLGGRTQDNIIYFDNISFSPATVPESPAEAAPTPTLAEANVISIFSDAYTNIDGVNLNPAWGQSTVVTEMAIEGNNTLLYTGLNYQGTEFISQDVSGMTYLHIDYWTDNSTALNFFVISQTPTVDSDYHTFALVSEQWVSVDIPLTTFPNVDLTDVFQFKVEGNGTIYWDNFYFYSNPVGIDDRSETLPMGFTLEQNFPNPFNPSTTIRFSIKHADHVVLKMFNIAGQEVFTLLDGKSSSGNHEVQFNANDLGSGTYFYSLTVGKQSSVKKMVLIK